ncbi:MAG TPA: DUF29 domain-containing protein [Candidatus Binataceae bacterium]|nr:DUF29 domain-containing protein [Candidatus Binataceae bacterium]
MISVRSSRNIAQATTPSLYETDYYAWIQEQVRALRAGDIENLDRENVAEELDDLARSVRRELESRLELIMSHLLKWTHQPGKRSASWENTIDEQRARVSDLLRENPSLKKELDEVLLSAYNYARRAAGNEMGLNPREWRQQLPAKCPWSALEILNTSYLPKTRARA